MAIVNGQKISKDEFTSRLKKAAGAQVLTDMILRDLVEQDFTSSGMKVDSKDVESRIKKIQAQFPSPEAFTQWLSSRNLTTDDLEKEVIFQIKLQDLRTKNVKPTEADLKKFFQDHQSQFNKPERVIISQIVVSGKQEADRVYSELQKPDANFGALARQYSIDPMFKQYGGRLPEMPIEQLAPPAVQAAAKALQVGKISHPLKVGGSYYIIELNDRKPAEKADYDKIQDEVKTAYDASQAEPTDALLKQLSDKAVVQIVDPDMASVQKQFMPKAKLPTFGNEGKKTPAGAPVTGAPSAAPKGAVPIVPPGAPKTGPAPAPAAPAGAAPAAPAAPATK